MLRKITLVTVLIVSTAISHIQAAAVDHSTASGPDTVVTFIAQGRELSSEHPDYQTFAQTAMHLLATGSLLKQEISFGITNAREWQNGERANYITLIDLATNASGLVDWNTIMESVHDDPLDQEHAATVRAIYMKKWAQKETPLPRLTLPKEEDTISPISHELGSIAAPPTPPEFTSIPSSLPPTLTLPLSATRRPARTPRAAHSPDLNTIMAASMAARRPNIEDDD